MEAIADIGRGLDIHEHFARELPFVVIARPGLNAAVNVRAEQRAIGHQGLHMAGPEAVFSALDRGRHKAFAVNEAERDHRAP